MLAATGSAATLGLAGCLGGGGLDEVTVAHMPIYPDLQWYVMEQEGYLDAIDATVTGQEFTEGNSSEHPRADGHHGRIGVSPAV